jgi:deoxyadenosine/deoxycytidine kinase
MEGPIGAGKTTLCESIANYSPDDTIALTEKINADFFALMMKSKKDLFAFQIATVTAKIERIKHAIALAEATGCTVLVDRGVVGDYAFAALAHRNGHISDEQWYAYNSVVLETPREALPSQMIRQIGAATQPVGVPPPLPATCSIMTVLLDVSPETAFARMKQRGNADEAAQYDLRYFQELRQQLLDVLDADEIVHVPYSEASAIDASTKLLREKDVHRFLAKLS